MNLPNKELVMPILFVLLLTIGQLGFRYLGQSSILTSFPKLSVLHYSILFMTLILYAIATIIWIYILSYLQLSKAIFFNAIIFVTVPLSAKYFFSEDVEIYRLAVACLLIFLALFILNR